MLFVLITGATRGLGFAAARAAADRGARVLAAVRSTESARAAAEALGGEPVVLDLERLADARQVADGLPDLDAVALNAGRQEITVRHAHRTVARPPSRSTTSLSCSSSIFFSHARNHSAGSC